MPRLRTSVALLAILLLAIILMVSGLQGSFGRLLCVLFAPGRLAIRDASQRSGMVNNVMQSVTPNGGNQQAL